MLKQAWILIGESNTKKSSVVRGLSTVDNSKTWVEIEECSGLRFQLRCFVTSLQESKTGIDGMTETLTGASDKLPSKVKADAGQDADVNLALQFGVANALIPLRYNSQQILPFPPGISYVERLIHDGWLIRAIVSLGEPERDWIRYTGIRFAAIPESKQLPGSIVAARIRQLFGWC